MKRENLIQLSSNFNRLSIKKIPSRLHVFELGKMRKSKNKFNINICWIVIFFLAISLLSNVTYCDIKLF